MPDELRARIEPLPPIAPRRAGHPGRRRLDDRKVLPGILFVLCTGIAWDFLPHKPGSGIHQAFMTLAAAIICRRHLTRRSFC